MPFMDTAETTKPVIDGNVTCGKTNPNIYESIRCKSTKYKNSFLPDFVDLWNNLSIDFQECNSLTIFKQKINTFIRPIPKSIFGIHNPKGLKCLFQLRVGLSPLRYDKKRHNFADTSSEICECGAGPEDASHYLFFCFKFLFKFLCSKSPINESSHSSST